MATKNLYTVAFTQNGHTAVSRFFQTIHAARNWAKFLAKLPGVTQTSLYRGPAGGELLERTGA